MVEHVADVQGPGHIGRWDDDRKDRPRRIYIGAEEPFLHPVLRPALLNLLRLVCFRNFSRHVPCLSALEAYYTDTGAGGQIHRSKGRNEKVYGLEMQGGSKLTILMLLDFSIDECLNDGAQKFLGNDVNDLGTHLIEDSLHNCLDKGGVWRGGF